MLSPRAVCHLSRPLIVGTRVLQVVPLFTPHFLLLVARRAGARLSWLQMIAKENCCTIFVPLPILYHYQSNHYFFLGLQKAVVVKMIDPSDLKEVSLN